MSAIDAVVGIVLLALRFAGLGTRQEPHVELLRGLGAQSLFQVVGNLVGIDEVYVHALGHVTRSHTVESVGVDERVALYHLHTVLEGLCAQLLIVVVLRGIDEEVTTYHTVHQHGDASMLTCLTDKLSQIVVEGGARVGMTVGLGLLVVMSELDNDIVAGLHALDDLVPMAFIDERARRATVQGTIVHPDIVVEIALQNHSPAALQLAS